MNTQTTVLYYEASFNSVFRGLLRWGLGVVALWYITRLFPQWLSYPRADLLKTLLDFIWAGVLLAVIQSGVKPLTLHAGPAGRQTQVPTGPILLLLNPPLALLVFGLSSLINTLILLVVTHYSSLGVSGFGGAFLAALMFKGMAVLIHRLVPTPRQILYARSG